MKTYITQKQAEAFAHRRATKYVHRSAPGYASYAFVPHTLMDFVRDIEAAAIQHYRDSLVAGVVLPEPVGYLAWKDGKPCWEGDDCVCEDAVYPVCSDDDRTSKAIYTADQVRLAIADALCVAEKETAELRLYKHNMEARFKGLNNMLKDALAKREPDYEQSETYLRKTDGIDALAKQVTRAPMFEFRECEDSQAAAPDPKE